jgi:phospholipid transport system transporter-binding protein
VITHADDGLQVTGDVTIATVSALFDAGLKAQKNDKTSNGVGDMGVDFSRLGKVDSSAVSLMLVWLREAQRNKVSLRFIHVPGNLLSLAKLYGVAELLTLSTAE